MWHQEPCDSNGSLPASSNAVGKRQWSPPSHESSSRLTIVDTSRRSGGKGNKSYLLDSKGNNHVFASMKQGLTKFKRFFQNSIVGRSVQQGLQAIARRAAAPNVDCTIHVLLWGAKRSGKTAIMYRWKLESFIPTVPTVGVLEESFVHSLDWNLSTEKIISPSNLDEPGASSFSPPSSIIGNMRAKGAECDRLTMSQINNQRPSRLVAKVEMAEIGRDPVSLEMKVADLPEETPVSSTTSSTQSADSVWGDSFRPPNRSGDNSFLPDHRYSGGNKPSHRKICHSCSRCLRRCQRACFHLQRRTAMGPEEPDYAVKVWTRSVKRATAIAYVVDSSSQSSLAEMFEDVNFMMSSESMIRTKTKLLILVNKQDVAGAVTPVQVERMLNLPAAWKRRCHIIGVSALTGENVTEALAWVEGNALSARQHPLVDISDRQSGGLPATKTAKSVRLLDI